MSQFAKYVPAIHRLCFGENSKKVEDTLLCFIRVLTPDAITQQFTHPYGKTSFYFSFLIERHGKYEQSPCSFLPEERPQFVAIVILLPYHKKFKNSRDFVGYTFADYAIEKGDVKVLQLFLDTNFYTLDELRQSYERVFENYDECFLYNPFAFTRSQRVMYQSRDFVYGSDDIY